MFRCIIYIEMYIIHLNMTNDFIEGNVYYTSKHDQWFYRGISILCNILMEDFTT
jgi:hypothetical protein